MTDQPGYGVLADDVTVEVQNGGWKGLPLTIYRSLRKGTVQDYTNGGLTASVDEVTVIGVIDNREDLVWGVDHVARVPSGMWLSAPTVERPAAVLVFRRFGEKVIAHVAPWPSPRTRGRGMAGGNYAATSDSRVARLVEDYGVWGQYGAFAVHDRFETETTGPGPVPVFATDGRRS